MREPPAAPLGLALKDIISLVTDHGSSGPARLLHPASFPMSTSAGTTIVNVSPDTALNLSEFVCFLVEARRPEAGRALFAECSAHIAGAETESLLTKLIDQNEAILQAEQEADAEGCFQAMVPIVFTLPEPDQQARLVKRIIAALTSSVTSKPTLRLRMLVSVFNLMVSAESKHELLTGRLSN